MGRVYKLIAKVLANWLKKLVRQIVIKAYSTFLEGRQILDIVLIANEVVNSMVRSKETNILWKLDIEKLYEQLNWNFLFWVL